MALSVPGIEVSHNRHLHGAGCPDSKKDSFIFFVRHSVCAKKIVKSGMASLTKKIDICLSGEAQTMDDTTLPFFFQQTHLLAYNDAIIADKPRILFNLT